MKHNHIRRAAALACAATLTLAGCTASDVAKHNAEQAADNFDIPRRIVFVNGITDKYLLSIEGYCSIDEQRTEGKAQLSVICKVGPDQYKRHFLGLSDNVTYVVEQVQATTLSDDHYRVVFKPDVIVPDVKGR